MQDTMRLNHIQDLLGQFALLWLWQGKVFSSEAAHLFVWWYPLPVTSPERVQEGVCPPLEQKVGIAK